MAGTTDSSGAMAVVQQTAQNLSTSQVTVGTTATLILPARLSPPQGTTGVRYAITLVNLGTNPLYFGPTSGVTTSNGVLLAGAIGASITIPYAGALYGIGAVSQAISVMETF